MVYNTAFFGGCSLWMYRNVIERLLYVTEDKKK